MKKLFILIFLLTIAAYVSISQTYTATLAFDDVKISDLKPGDTITLPIRLVEKSGGLITGFAICINFDHSLFSWQGTYEFPLNGMRNFHKNVPYNNANWVINDNSTQVVAIWYDPTFVGQEISPNEVFFEIIFKCKKEISGDYEKIFSWGKTYEEVDGRVVRAVTEMYSEIPDFYTLKMTDGLVK